KTDWSKCRFCLVLHTTGLLRLLRGGHVGPPLHPRNSGFEFRRSRRLPTCHLATIDSIHATLIIFGGTDGNDPDRSGSEHIVGITGSCAPAPPRPIPRDQGVKRLACDESAVVSGPPPTSGRAPRGSPAAAPPTCPLG